MSVVKLFDTNTIFEPINLCTCGKIFRVEEGQMIKYSIEKINGQIYLCLDGISLIPLIEMKN